MPIRSMCYSAVAAVFALAALSALSAVPARAQVADTAVIDGIWEGPWYRGMSSGRAILRSEAGGGSLQLSNGESFGVAPVALSKVAFDGKVFRFRAEGGGGALTAALELDEAGDRMRGMGKYEGFGVRFELTRARR